MCRHNICLMRKYCSMTAHMRRAGQSPNTFNHRCLPDVNNVSHFCYFEVMTRRAYYIKLRRNKINVTSITNIFIASHFNATKPPAHGGNQINRPKSDWNINVLFLEQMVEALSHKTVPGSIHGWVLGKFSDELFLLSALSGPGVHSDSHRN